MDTTSLKSTVNKAREQFENGHAKACVETLKGVLGDLKVGEPEWYRLRNDTSFLLARLSGLERERGMISEQNHMVEWNKLFHSTNQLLLDFEAGVKEMEKKEKAEEPGLYPAELVLGLDYEKTDMEEVKLRVSRIEHVLNLGRGIPERIAETRAGSVIVKLNLYAEEIVKIKSLVKLGLVEDVEGFKVLDGSWEWIEGEDFVLWLEGVNFKGVKLNEADLRGANLRGADLRGAALRRASLSEAGPVTTKLEWAKIEELKLKLTKLEEAKLEEAKLKNAKLEPARLEGVNLLLARLRMVNLLNIELRRVSANLYYVMLSRVDFSGADLSGADLSDTDLSDTDLSGANLSDTILHRTIFHNKHRELLESMGIDISNVIFIDDEGKKVDIGVVVE